MSPVPGAPAGPAHKSPGRGRFERPRPYIVGSPEEVVEKILLQHEIFGHQWTLFQLAIGSVGHADLIRAIELLGTEVAPDVRSELGSDMRIADQRDRLPAPTGRGDVYGRAHEVDVARSS